MYGKTTQWTYIIFAYLRPSILEETFNWISVELYFRQNKINLNKNYVNFQGFLRKTTSYFKLFCFKLIGSSQASSVLGYPNPPQTGSKLPIVCNITNKLKIPFELLEVLPDSAAKHMWVKKIAIARPFQYHQDLAYRVELPRLYSRHLCTLISSLHFAFVKSEFFLQDDLSNRLNLSERFYIIRLKLLYNVRGEQLVSRIMSVHYVVIFLCYHATKNSLFSVF